MPRLLFAGALAPLAALVLAACGDEAAETPGGVSPAEVKALEDAASMLDERQLPPEALPTDAPPAEMTGDPAPARR